MSLLKVKNIFEEAKKCKEWNLYLLTIERIKHEISYSAHSLQIRNGIGINDIAKEVANLYLEKN